MVIPFFLGRTFPVGRMMMLPLLLLVVQMACHFHPIHALAASSSSRSPWASATWKLLIELARGCDQVLDDNNGEDWDEKTSSSSSSRLALE